MSKLLERAIIDAQALKEAALKSAEQLVIEKYSDEIKMTMDKLIEQDDLGAGLDDLATGMGMEDTTDEAPIEEPAEDPSAEEEEGLDRDSVLGTLPDSFSADDDEVISIKLDSLEAEYSDEEDEGLFGGDDEFDDGEIGIDIVDDEEELGGEEELDDTELGFDEEPEGEDINLDDEEIGVEINEQAILETLEEMGIDSEEIDLEDLMEKVTVDFEPQKSGWAGTPETIMKEYEAMLLAREQDSEVKEENEELRKTVKALKQENKTLTSAARKLQMQTEKYETAFNTLQEKLETMNVSNAKLLILTRL